MLVDWFTVFGWTVFGWWVYGLRLIPPSLFSRKGWLSNLDRLRWRCYVVAMAKRRTYDPEVKAQVLAALLTGQGAEKVAEQYEIPVGTAKAWKAKAKGAGKVATQKKEKIGALLLDYLAVSLATLKKQAEVFEDEAWLKRQDASTVAVLHGVLADKAVRLLEALAPGADDAGAG